MRSGHPTPIPARSGFADPYAMRQVCGQDVKTKVKLTEGSDSQESSPPSVSHSILVFCAADIVTFVGIHRRGEDFDDHESWAIEEIFVRESVEVSIMDSKAPPLKRRLSNSYLSICPR